MDKDSDERTFKLTHIDGQQDHDRNVTAAGFIEDSGWITFYDEFDRPIYTVQAQFVFSVELAPGE